MKHRNHVDKSLGRSNSPLLTFLMGIILLVSGSCKEEEITPSKKLDFSASGPAATADNPAIATADKPVDMSWSQHSSYTDSNGSIVDCTPRASFHLSVSKTIVKAKSIEELIAMKESSSQDQSGSAPVRHQMRQTFEIGEQTVSFDMSYEAYSYKNAHQEIVDMPYVKLNPVRYGEATPTDNPDDEGHTVLSSVTSVRIRPANLTRGSVVIDNLYDVTVTFNMESETVGDSQNNKKKYTFEVKYQAWVESLFEFPDPKTTFDYSFGVVGGTASKESPFVVNAGEKMELEWKGQSRHTWFDVSEMEQKVFSEEPYARMDITLENDTISKYSTSKLEDMLPYTVSDPVHVEKDAVTKGTMQMKITPLDQKLKQQTITINWSYFNGSTAQTAYGDIAMPYLMLGDPELSSVETSPLESGSLPDGLNGYEVRLRFRQKFSTVNDETPHSEMVQYVVKYVIVEDIRLVQVKYRKDSKWIERTDSTAMAFYPVVYRDRIYSNGQVFTDTFIDDPHFVSWTSSIGPSKFTDEGGSLQWSNGRHAFFEAAEYVNKDNSYTCSIVVGVPRVSNLSASVTADGYTTPFPGVWDAYERHKRLDPETRVPLDGVEVVGTYEMSSQPSGWYLLEPHYDRQLTLYTKDAPDSTEPFMNLTLHSSFMDSYLIVDGIKMSYLEGRNKMTLNHTETNTTYGNYVAKRYTHKGSTTFYGKTFEVIAEATLYQLPAGMTRAAESSDLQNRSSATQKRSQRYNTLPIPYGPTPRFIYGGKPKGVKGRY